ncbi:hypothetical protein D1BOALGB6SA_4761 [Olavius sp. associated proteobacterium Delta 1]|nr:hypothetical protein D1BOALGB6SA_4761 [Olavius sp. associated proteobacterium Delta 1]
MQSSSIQIGKLILMISLSLVIGISWLQAEEQRDMQGWGIDDPYNKLYDVREFEKIRAYVVRVKEVVPMPGMSPATALDVREGAYIHEIHLCPTWYRKPSEIRLKKNERIKVKGVWAEVNGKDIFMASKVKKDPDTDILKVRLTKDGTPFWTMTSQQLAKEMSEE